MQDLAAAEGQQLAGERGGALRGHQNLFRGGAVGIVGRLVVANHLGVAFDDGQQVIEVVRDAAGELSDRLQFLRLA